MATSTVERHAHPNYERLYLIRRSRSKFWYADTYLDGRKVRRSLKAFEIPLALKLAESWYKKALRASVDEGRKHPLDRLATDPTVAEVFSHYRMTLPPAKRQYADVKWGPIQHFWRALIVPDITSQTFRDFYAWRRTRKTPQKTTITNHALHKDMMVVRQILKFSIEEGHLKALPIIPKVGQIKANPRPWLTRPEWEHLMKVSEKRIEDVVNNDRLYQQRVETHEFAQMMVVTMCRVNPRCISDRGHPKIGVHFIA